MKYLKTLFLSLNLLDATIWPTFTGNKSIGSLDLWNYFFLSLILLNFTVFSLIFYITEKNKNYLFLTLFFNTEPILDIYIFFWILFNLVFFFLWLVFIMLSWLLFYSFFVLLIILSSFSFRLVFLCYLQDFLPIKPVVIPFSHISLTNQ